MVSIVDNKRTGKKYDKRIKLDDGQRAMIKLLASMGHSQRSLARQFDVSRRLITFIIDPSKLEANRQRRSDRGGWALYYDKDSHKEHMRKHRAHKAALLASGKID